MKNTEAELEKTLPFDQYSRQRIVSHIIENSIRKVSKNKKLKIIDLGGHKGKTTDFQPDDHVTILDVFDESYEGYVKGDATKTNFKNNEFDVSCSFDVFEHIPRENRKAFIEEALRISNRGLFVAMPIDFRGRVATAEKLLNDFHRRMFSIDHPWLKEHIEYKIPTEKEVLNLVKEIGAHSTCLYSNEVGDWQLMQMLVFSASRNPEITAYVNEANSWYNKHILKLDSGVNVGYRGIFFISKNDNDIHIVQSAIADFRSDSHKIEPPLTVNSETFKEFSKTLAKISKNHTEILVKYNEVNKKRAEFIEENARLKYNLGTLAQENDALLKELSAIRSSPSWRVTKPLRAARKVLTRKRDNG